MIGIFDSGFGGLTVMKEYLKRYPEFDYLYLGDQANSPYGARSAELVNQLLQKNVAFLIKKGAKLIIVACNTASAEALRQVQQIYKGNPPILGVLVPAVEEALRSTRFGRIGVMATRGTVKSGAYEREIQKYAPKLYKPADKRALKMVLVTSQACPLLVPLIEEGLIDHGITRMILKTYLRPFKNAHVDTLILGCTHYPLLLRDIQRIMGRQVKIISSATAAAEAIGDYFKRHPEVKAFLGLGGTRKYLTTDSAERFTNFGSLFLGQKIQGQRVEF